MRNINIVYIPGDIHIDIREEEVKLLEDYVKKEDGIRILWNLWNDRVEKGDAELKILPWINREGVIYMTPLRDIS